MILNALVDNVLGSVVVGGVPPPGSSDLASAIRRDGDEQLPTEERDNDPRLIDDGIADNGVWLSGVFGDSGDVGDRGGLPGSQGVATVSRYHLHRW